MKLRTLFIALVTILTISSQAQANPVTVESLPASVVKTVPESGDLSVDPDLKEITVSFSKDMQTNQWSVCQISAETYPKPDGKTHYRDRRTCVVPVKLEPNKTYVVWFNLEHWKSFQDKNNIPSVPYLLAFKTGPRK